MDYAGEIKGHVEKSTEARKKAFECYQEAMKEHDEATKGNLLLAAIFWVGRANNDMLRATFITTGLGAIT